MSRALVFTTIVACVMFSSSIVSAQQATAKLTSDVVEVGQTFQYTVTVAVRGNDRISIVKAPDFGSLHIVGQSRIPQIITVNGVTERRLVVRYSLRATRPAEVEIEPPEFVVGSGRVIPDTLSVEVVPRGESPQPALDDSPHFINTEIHPEKPYVGQQVNLQYDLYVDARQPDVTPTQSNEPSLDEFWIEELTNRSISQDQMVNVRGRLMKRSPMWAYALFPLNAGEVTIEPAKVELMVGAFFRRGKTVSVASDPIPLDVRPLPPDAPAGFYEGNVGNYSFRVRSDQSMTRVGRAIVVDVSVNGEGQLSRVRLPELPQIDGVRVSDVDEEVNQKIRGLTVGGTTKVSYTLTPLKEGTFTIPRLKFSHFDPEREKYVTTESDPIHVKVAAGVLPPEPIAEASLPRRDVAADQDLVASLLDRLAPPIDQPSLAAAPDRASFPVVYWPLILGAILALLGVLFGEQAKRWLARAAPDRARRAATRSSVDALKDAGEDPGVIAAAIRDGLHTAHGIPRGLVTAAELRGAFAQRDLDPEVGEELAAVLAVCEEARFAPDAAVDAADLTDRARAALLRLTDDSTPRRTTQGGSTIAAIFALFMTLAVYPPPVIAADALQRAVDAQKREDWSTAAQAWADAATANPAAADVWYNYGTTAALAGEYGDARWALERAAYLAPWSDDVENNRHVVERIVRLVSIERSRTGRTIDGDETLFWWRLAAHLNPHLAAAICIALWLLAAALVLLRRRTESAATRDAAFIGFVLALLLAGLALGGLIVRDHLLSSTQPVVVIADLELREGPNAAAKLKPTPPAMMPGTLLRATDWREKWVKIAWQKDSGWTTLDSVKTVR